MISRADVWRMMREMVVSLSLGPCAYCVYGYVVLREHQSPACRNCGATYTLSITADERRRGKREP